MRRKNIIIVPRQLDKRVANTNHGEHHISQYQRRRSDILKEVRGTLSILDAVKSLKQDTLYKLVIPEGKLLQKNAKGLFRGVFYNDKRIDVHAQFKAVSPGLLSAAKVAGSQVMLISISMQLSRIEALVESVIEEFHRDRIAEVLAGIQQFEKAMLFHDAENRKHALLNSIQTLHQGLSKTILELANDVRKAPSPESKFWEHLDPMKSRVKDAKKNMGQAQESLGIALTGIKTLAEAYSVLGEPQAASRSLLGYFDGIRQCDVNSAIDKSRLVECIGPVKPQTPWEEFLKLDRKARAEFDSFLLGESNHEESIEVEFMASEIGVV